MKWLILLQALVLCVLPGCSVNDDPMYSPANPYSSLDQARRATAVPDEGDPYDAGVRTAPIDHHAAFSGESIIVTAEEPARRYGEAGLD